MDDGLYGLPHSPEEAGVVVVPVPWEATASYGRGTAGGPAAVFAAAPHLDLYDTETGRPYEAGIAMLPVDAEVEAWNHEARADAEPVLDSRDPGDDPDLKARVARVDALSERMNAWVFDRTVEWLDRGKLVGVLGGDHASPFGAIKAVSERHPGLGILHMDAHCDLRDSFEGFRWSHGSIFHNVMERLGGVDSLVQLGIRDVSNEEIAYVERSSRVWTSFDADAQRRMLEGEAWSTIIAPAIHRLPEQVYVSFDIDGLDPALCPHTGTPVPGGLSFAQACALLRAVVDSGRRIVGFDLCEVAPDPSGQSRIDAIVGARMLYKLIGFSLLSRREE